MPAGSVVSSVVDTLARRNIAFRPESVDRLVRNAAFLVVRQQVVCDPAFSAVLVSSYPAHISTDVPEGELSAGDLSGHIVGALRNGNLYGKVLLAVRQELRRGMGHDMEATTDKGIRSALETIVKSSKENAAADAKTNVRPGAGSGSGSGAGAGAGAGSKPKPGTGFTITPKTGSVPRSGPGQDTKVQTGYSRVSMVTKSVMLDRTVLRAGDNTVGIDDSLGTAMDTLAGTIFNYTVVQLNGAQRVIKSGIGAVSVRSAAIAESVSIRKKNVIP
jgi:hypothetical protein